MASNTTTTESIFETRGVVESQPVTTARMPGDGSDSCSLLNSAIEAGCHSNVNSNVVTGLPPSGTLKRNKQRRIEVDYSLLHDDDTFSQASTSRAGGAVAPLHGGADSRKMVTKENDQNVHNVPLRRRKLKYIVRAQVGSYGGHKLGVAIIFFFH